MEILQTVKQKLLSNVRVPIVLQKATRLLPNVGVHLIFHQLLNLPFGKAVKKKTDMDRRNEPDSARPFLCDAVHISARCSSELFRI